jgi:molybdate transport system substrate-binding protein
MLRALVATLALLLVGAAPAPPVVLAAASLQESMNAAADAWARHGHVRPVISFAASSALARLLAAGTRADFLGNRLVVVGAPGGPAHIPARGAALARVLGVGPLAMADPDSVPAGKYGKAALIKLGAWEAVAPHVVRAESVRAALALVERGAAPFAIVYATDARAARSARVVGMFPANSHPPIVYPLARLKTATNPDGEGFRRFLLSREGRAIFVGFGFTAR